MKKFDNNVNIGDKFIKGRNIECVVVDIVKTFSTARNEWNDSVIYLARQTNGLVTNAFDVSKSTIVRGRM